MYVLREYIVVYVICIFPAIGYSFSHFKEELVDTH